MFLASCQVWTDCVLISVATMILVGCMCSRCIVLCIDFVACTNSYY
ncbi:hypothetical protein PC121_g14116 [Phytophthora cactorum]|nr:hypothetical protein PC121_g14116 [Phytophthora cactorum]